jgi:Sulfotransferase family
MDTVKKTKLWSANVSPITGGRGRALDAGEMMAAALKRADRRDFADRSFVQPLQQLLSSCNAEGHLNGLGRYSVRFDVLRSLRNLLAFDRIEQADPSILSRPIERPVFITGTPRSGTTFLHRLLAQDPSTAAPRSWQLVYPLPSGGGRMGAVLRRSWVGMQLRMVRVLAPELHELHTLSAGAPEECTDITAQVFQSSRYDSVYRVPGYQNWLKRYGLLEGYRFHRRFLQHLDAQQPGRRWILKSPDHVFALDDIRAVYPDARLVFVHRDPVRVLASVAKLTEVLRRPFAHSIDLPEIGRQVSASWLEGARLMMRAAAASNDILHLHYREVVSAPLEAVGAIARHCGLTVSAEAQARMRSWLSRERGGRNGRRHYQLATFGLDPHSLREQFAPYIEAFDIPAERDLMPLA